MAVPSIAPDPLGEALHFLRMSGTFYCRCEVAAPWGLDLPPMRDTMMFHVVTAGRTWVEVDGAEPLLLQAGDVALVPHGEGHRLGSEPGTRGQALFDIPREMLGDRYEVIRLDGGGPAGSLLCGAVRFDHPASRHLVGLLPRVIGVDTSDALQREWMQSTIRFIASEAARLRPGGEVVITRLADVLVVQAIRSWIEHDGGARTGWLGALRDPQIGKAITLIHRDPAREWTVETLAAQVAMSRSAFAARFAALVGQTPMRYLARWRMSVAVGELEDGTVTVEEAALRSGYQSEAAFSRAFKRLMGISPGSVRRKDDGVPPAP